MDEHLIVDSSVSAIINAPLEEIDLPAWRKTGIPFGSLWQLLKCRLAWMLNVVTAIQQNSLKEKTEMVSLKSLRTMAILFFLVGVVSGCAETRQCGLEGCPNDQKITTSVRTRLDQQPDLGPPGSITVQTVNRVVYLNGLVDDGLEKTSAESAARQVAGVTRVVNNIAVEH
jgi:hypothetical protein